MAESQTLVGELSSPYSRLPSFAKAQRGYPETVDQEVNPLLFLGSHASVDLLDIDRGRPRGFKTPAAESAYAARRGTTTEGVNEDGTVENDAQALPNALRIYMTLLPNPFSRIGIPFVSGLAVGFQCLEDPVPAGLVVEGLPHGLSDKSTALACTDSGIETGYQMLIESNVQTHGHRLTH